MRMAAPAEIPLDTCPACGKATNRASAINEPGIYASPVGGDTTICMECMTWLVFRDDLSLRRMKQSEIDGLTAEEREPMVELGRALKRINELKTSRPKVR